MYCCEVVFLWVFSITKDIQIASAGYYKLSISMNHVSDGFKVRSLPGFLLNGNEFFYFIIFFNGRDFLFFLIQTDTCPLAASLLSEK